MKRKEFAMGAEKRQMTRPWGDIVAHYEKGQATDASMRGVYDLARRIEGSALATGLFGWTSMYLLCITQMEVFYPYDGPYLSVAPLYNGQIRFRYVDTPDEKKQWER